MRGSHIDNRPNPRPTGHSLHKVPESSPFLENDPEKERFRVIAILAGEVLELEETFPEAKAALTMPPADPIEPDDFPFPDVDVDNIVNPEDGSACSQGARAHPPVSKPIPRSSR
jgi:hypothetical protein